VPYGPEMRGLPASTLPPPSERRINPAVVPRPAALPDKSGVPPCQGASLDSCVEMSSGYQIVTKSARQNLFPGVESSRCSKSIRAALVLHPRLASSTEDGARKKTLGVSAIPRCSNFRPRHGRAINNPKIHERCSEALQSRNPGRRNPRPSNPPSLQHSTTPLRPVP